jgi:hypothetical protein
MANNIHNPGYGNQSLSVVTSNPQNYDEILRNMNRIEGVPGSTSGGFFSDSSDSLAAKMQSISVPPEFLQGTIYHAFSGLYTYLVIADNNKGKVVCSDMFGPLRVQIPNVNTMYSIGSRVIIMRFGSSDYGVIIGSPSEPIFNPGKNYSHLISGIGAFHYHNRLYIRTLLDNQDTAKGIPSYARNRPADSCEGDYSITNMSGGGFHTDAFQTSIRQSQACGVWAFGMDYLLRLVGRSLQEFSAAHERYRGFDEHETYGFEGIALYPWEAYGFFEEPDTLYKKYEGDACKYGKGVGFMEPEDPSLIPFYRVHRYDGFIGQGTLQEIVVPPKDAEEKYIATDDKVPICVNKQHSLSDGTFIVETTQALHLVKHSNIRTFKRTHEIDDPSGDDAKQGGYTASELKQIPQRPTHKANITDQMLWATRIQSPASFETHSGDFKKIEREQYLFEKDVQTGNLQDLLKQDSIEEAPVEELKISKNGENVEVSGSRASISILPDGGIVLRGACGEEILLQGGNITLSCPGDIRIMPARSVISLAGDDTVLRAKNSIDITATDNDVRIKAERNLDMVGGMSGRGRTLVENKSTASPANQDVKDLEGENIGGHGLILKAQDSMVGVFGHQIYTRSLNSGSIIMDADGGKGSTKIRATYFGVEVQGRIDLCGGAGSLDAEAKSSGEGGGSTILAITSQQVAISTASASGSMLRVFGRIAAQGSVTTNDHFTALQSTDVSKFKNNKGNFPDETLQFDQDRRRTFHEYNGQYFQKEFYTEDKIGTEEAIKNYTFSYRTTDQCGAGRFAFKEPYWMELYGEEKCSALVSWSEPIYNYQETINQLPWPGYKAWEEDESITTKLTGYYNAEKGIDVDEGGAGGPEKKTPAEFLKIIDPR